MYSYSPEFLCPYLLYLTLPSPPWVPLASVLETPGHFSSPSHFSRSSRRNGGGLVPGGVVRCRWRFSAAVGRSSRRVDPARVIHTTPLAAITHTHNTEAIIHSHRAIAHRADPASLGCACACRVVATVSEQAPPALAICAALSPHSLSSYYRCIRTTTTHPHLLGRWKGCARIIAPSPHNPIKDYGTNEICWTFDVRRRAEATRPAHSPRRGAGRSVSATSGKCANDSDSDILLSATVP